MKLRNSLGSWNKQYLGSRIVLFKFPIRPCQSVQPCMESSHITLMSRDTGQHTVYNNRANSTYKELIKCRSHHFLRSYRLGIEGNMTGIRKSRIPNILVGYSRLGYSRRLVY